jgi:hypothetical protein
MTFFRGRRNNKQEVVRACRKPNSTNQVPHVREAMLATETPDVRDCTDYADFTDSSNATDCNQPDIRVNVDSRLQQARRQSNKTEISERKVIQRISLTHSRPRVIALGLLQFWAEAPG